MFDHDLFVEEEGEGKDVGFSVFDRDGLGCSDMCGRGRELHEGGWNRSGVCAVSEAMAMEGTGWWGERGRGKIFGAGTVRERCGKGGGKVEEGCKGGGGGNSTKWRVGMGREWGLWMLKELEVTGNEQRGTVQAWNNGRHGHEHGQECDDCKVGLGRTWDVQVGAAGGTCETNAVDNDHCG